MPSTHRSAVIAAPADRVWRTLRDFHDLSWAPRVVSECRPVGRLAGDQVGARRVLNGAFHETLRALDDEARATRYSVDDGPSPVSPAEVRDFVAEIRVRPDEATRGTRVDWSARWQAANDDACAFAGGIYEALLADLARTCESD